VRGSDEANTATRVSLGTASFMVRPRAERGFRCEDALGEVLGSVANRSARRSREADDSGRPHRRQKLSSEHLRCRTEDTRR